MPQFNSLGPICAMRTKLYRSPDLHVVQPNSHKMPHFPSGTRCKYDDQDENFSVSNWSSPESLHSDWLSLSLSLPFWSSASAVEIEIHFIRTVLFSVLSPASF